jgi:hypothetical protein
MQKILSLSPIADLNSIITSGDIISFDIGFDGLVYIGIALPQLAPPLEEPELANVIKKKEENSSKYSTPSSPPQSYRIITLLEDLLIFDIDITVEEDFKFSFVQPLGWEEIMLVPEIMLVAARSSKLEKNARIYNYSGEFSREFWLGDAIESVQTTSNGVIWTSYFDEGIANNFGKLVGLAAWDSSGNKIYDFEPSDGSMIDCYALNVESDADVWLYYYTTFPLVRLHHHKIESMWDMPIAGSHSFAVFGNRVLLSAGYSERDTYYLFDLSDNSNVKLIKQFQFTDEIGEAIIAWDLVGRGKYLYILSNKRLVYRVDVSRLEEFL